MPRFTVHASNFPLGIPHKRLGTVVAADLEQARKAAETLHNTTHITIQLEGAEIEAKSTSPTA